MQAIGKTATVKEYVSVCDNGPTSKSYIFHKLKGKFPQLFTVKARM